MEIDVVREGKARAAAASEGGGRQGGQCGYGGRQRMGVR